MQIVKFYAINAQAVAPNSSSQGTAPAPSPYWKTGLASALLASTANQIEFTMTPNRPKYSWIMLKWSALSLRVVTAPVAKRSTTRQARMTPIS